jgi:hypothetical protein
LKQPSKLEARKLEACTLEASSKQT